jgi:3',5'-cyclic AMP phosphodiesterase CpdA
VTRFNRQYEAGGSARTKGEAALRIAITADLHYGGARGRGDQATRLLAGHLYEQPPDLLILAGDIGTVEHFGLCLELFAALPCRKALVPGNHDIWVTQEDERGDSLRVYHEHLPRISAEHGFHYLDHGPLYLPDADLAVVGSINWYDYSWSIGALKQRCDDWAERLSTKRFISGGRHNDARFVRWALDDCRFTAEVVAVLERQLQEGIAQAHEVIVVTHHPPFYGLNWPRSADAPLETDQLLWDAFSGNRALEAVLERHAERIPLAFCGHTHRERENTLRAIHGYNVGGDYHFKRLLMLDWPERTVAARVFDNPEA